MIVFVAALTHGSSGWVQSGATGTAPRVALEPVDPVTDAVEQNPLTMLRIAAINLEKPSDQGHALSGIVAAFLKRDRISDATIDFDVISDPLWRARALVHFAEHARDNGRPTEAREKLAEASSLLDPEIARRDRSQTLGMISRGQAELGAFKDAVATAVKVPHTPQRIEFSPRDWTDGRRGEDQSLGKMGECGLRGSLPAESGLQGRSAEEDRSRPGDRQGHDRHG